MTRRPNRRTGVGSKPAPNSVEIEAPSEPRVSQKRRNGPRTPLGNIDDVEVPDARVLFQEHLPYTPETVADRVEHCRRFPEQRGGRGPAAFDALFEIAFARAFGFAWGTEGGGPADPPDEEDPRSTIMVPAWIVAELALPWSKFRVKQYPDLDTAFGVQTGPKNRLHFADRKKQDLDTRARLALVFEVQRRYRLTKSKAIAEVAAQIGVTTRTLQRDLKKLKDSGQVWTMPGRKPG